MDSAIFEELERSLSQDGPVAAIERLCTRLREQKDYASLFYALLLKKRHELGVLPLPTAPAQELPASMHAPYEEAIRSAGRLVTQLYLDEGQIPQAWAYARMLGDHETIKKALERHQPAEGEDLQPLVHIAFYEGVHQHKGFDWIVERFGICNAITTMSNPEFPQAADVRQYCYERLVRALYQELRDRLTAEIERREGQAPACASAPAGTRGVIRELMRGHDWLFEDDYYHIDISHLGSVVQMSISLPSGDELEMARELCEYGQRISEKFKPVDDPPFEDQYRDYGVYLATLAGDRVEEGIAHFRAKVENADPEKGGTYPAEVLVNLLLRLGRPKDALAMAQKYLTDADPRRLSCPGIGELCQKANDYQALADVARRQGDAVHFMAGLLAAR